MTIKRILLAIAFPLMLTTLVSCDLLEDATKSEYDKELEYITKVWKVDSVRVREYGYILPTFATPLVRSELAPITKMEFLRNEGASAGKLIQTSIDKGKEVVTELEWRYDGEYMRITFPSPLTPGRTPEPTIFNMVELTDKKLIFKREENLVDDRSAVRYGSLDRYYYLSK